MKYVRIFLNERKRIWAGNDSQEISNEEFKEMKAEIQQQIGITENQIADIQISDVSIEEEIEIALDCLHKMKLKWPDYSKDK